MAVILIDHNSVFVHVPKTGGMSVQHWLLENTNATLAKAKKHRSLQQLEQTYGKFNYSFAVVRNPWDWCVSWYFFSKERAERRLKNPDPVQKGKRNIEYNKQVLENFSKGFEYFTEHTLLKEQYTKVQGVTTILKLENINEDIKIIKDKFKIKGELPYVNRSTTREKNYRQYYTDRSKDIIAKKFANDISMFGYEF